MLVVDKADRPKILVLLSIVPKDKTAHSNTRQ